MEEERVKRSWCPWLAIGSWLMASGLILCLCVLCVDLFKKKTKPVSPHVQEEFVSVVSNKVITQPSIKVESELKIDAQKSYEDTEKEFNARIEELESLISKLEFSKSSIEESIRDLSIKFGIDETRIGTAETRIGVVEARVGAVEKH